MAARYVAALDQGTTSTRCLLFDHQGRIVASAQREHRQSFPQPGWVEHDPHEIMTNAVRVLTHACASVGARAGDIAALGIANQRETTVVWERATGTAIHPAIVWQDTRTDGICAELAEHGGTNRFRDRVGLPLASYFSGPKISWILDHVPGARARAERGELAAGTIDSYLTWQLTGGPSGGIHVTDVTNASRTMLMDLTTLAWAGDICMQMGVPMAVLPEIRPSSQVIGTMAGRLRLAPDGDGEQGSPDMTLPDALAGVPIAGILGDQQAALVGQLCLDPGTAKATYGTGNFLLLNTGTEPVFSRSGLLTTVAYQLGDGPAVFAVEGSVAVTGSLVQWLRDGLGIVDSAAEIEELAARVPDCGGAYIVPAFSGLFAPYWRPDARGVIVGLTRFVTKAHVARAALEAVAFQTADVVGAMAEDTGRPMAELQVDGGMAVNGLLLQIQADLIGCPVIRPTITETTALGAAYAAGLAVGFWADTEELRSKWQEDRRYLPTISAEERTARLSTWRKAVERSLDWV